MRRVKSGELKISNILHSSISGIYGSGDSDGLFRNRVQLCCGGRGQKAETFSRFPWPERNQKIYAMTCHLYHYFQYNLFLIILEFVMRPQWTIGIVRLLLVDSLVKATRPVKCSVWAYTARSLPDQTYLTDITQI